ncbi:MAG TPA: hypothetical protein DD664_01215 [Janibacter terrae]|nr:hypothetical protein [Janibacter terrae]
MSGPLSAVLAALADGTPSLAEVGRRTGLPAEAVRASVDHLIRLGRLEAKEWAMGCPVSGCGSCASATAEGTPGCGAEAPAAGRRGPVLVALSLRR